MPLTVVIVGAGIGGMATAVALRRSRHKVTVLEQHAEKAEVGYGLDLPSNASRILKSFDLDFAKVRGCHQTGIDFFVDEAKVVTWRRAEERRSKDDAPFFSVHRQDYYNALRSLAVDQVGLGPPAELRLSCKVTFFDADKGSVTLASGERIDADLVVAANGNYSSAHECVVGKEILPQPTGMTNVRFVLPTEVVRQVDGMDKFVQNGAKGRACHYSGPNGTTIMHYPCREGTLQNFGIYLETKNCQEWPEIAQSNKQDALERVSGMNDQFSSLIGKAKEEGMYLWTIVDRDPLPRLHRDRLVLVGDASHPMRPLMGQGAAQAVEDAAVLGIVLEDVDSKDELSARLQLWENLRRPRASTIQLMSRTNPGGEGWIHDGDKNKAMAQEFFPNGDLPLTRADMTLYAIDHDAVGEAKVALAKERHGLFLQSMTPK